VTACCADYPKTGAPASILTPLTSSTCTCIAFKCSVMLLAQVGRQFFCPQFANTQILELITLFQIRKILRRDIPQIAVANPQFFFLPYEGEDETNLLKSSASFWPLLNKTTYNSAAGLFCRILYFV
jgi:hypothetical protein